jgi:malic enzyme
MRWPAQLPATGCRPNECILPRLDEPHVAAEVAAAIGVAAQKEGLARVVATADELRARARATIVAAQEATQLLMKGRSP